MIKMVVLLNIFVSYLEKFPLSVTFDQFNASLLNENI